MSLYVVICLWCNDSKDLWTEFFLRIAYFKSRNTLLIPNWHNLTGMYREKYLNIYNIKSLAREWDLVVGQ